MVSCKFFTSFSLVFYSSLKDWHNFSNTSSSCFFASIWSLSYYIWASYLGISFQSIDICSCTVIRSFISLYFCYFIMLASDLSSASWEFKCLYFNLIISQFCIISSSLLACIDSIQFRSPINYMMYCFFLSLYLFSSSCRLRSIYIALLYAFSSFYFSTANSNLICQLWALVFSIYSNNSSSLNLLSQYYFTAGYFSPIFSDQSQFSTLRVANWINLSSKYSWVYSYVFWSLNQISFSYFAISFLLVSSSLVALSLSSLIILIWLAYSYLSFSNLSTVRLMSRSCSHTCFFIFLASYSICLSYFSLASTFLQS